MMSQPQPQTQQVVITPLQMLQITLNTLSQMEAHFKEPPEPNDNTHTPASQEVFKSITHCKLLLNAFWTRINARAAKAKTPVQPSLKGM